MFIQISKSETGNNKGSCGQLVAYLEKENVLAEKIGGLDYRPEYWFNEKRNDIKVYEVRTGIDGNIRKLAGDEAKFYLINISPSEKEINHLVDRYGREGAKAQFKAYANEVMNAYARNFKRDRISSNGDLVYYGKLENRRYYSFRDQEVKRGMAKRGQAKPGEQMHLQVIVSRKDQSNSIKLSPLNNSKGSNAKHSEKVGQFDRVAFKHRSETLFDELFAYKRGMDETFRFANILKHGSISQRSELFEHSQKASQNSVRSSPEAMDTKVASDLLDVLLSKVHEDIQQPLLRRKKKKGTVTRSGGRSL
ncbi:molybdopterin-guanine dinucleotide biosynthesis protein MobB [Pedobacter sp. HMF7647]|uniref:Molybdopterin-guanine dinucleotide biosynthesis protein MobB n=1 Tax=Hufsiella arboris TaxID=2695275 RepID=A0A7K1Y6T1_9SPHI|nr:DUF5712 family protein [Hufsiella arboris]MXV50282.1 molybdopterin-guanine dinucleotide biosynthesis protein MobB [Hufsiella arboris]